MKKPKIVAVDTSLGTNFLVSACKDATMSELRGLIQTEHRVCFPEHGRISIKALMVEYDSKQYHVTESFAVGQLLRRSWNKIHAVVSSDNGRTDSRGSQPMQAGSLADDKKGSLVAVLDRSLPASGEAHQNSYCRDISAERRTSSEVAPAHDDDDEAYDCTKSNTDSQDHFIGLGRVGYPLFSFETPHTQPGSELNTPTWAVLNRELKREGKKRRGSHGEDRGAVSKKQREEGEQCSDEANKLKSMSTEAEEKQGENRGSMEDLGTRVTLHEEECGPPNVEEEPINDDEELKKDALSDDLRGSDSLKRLDKQGSIGEGTKNSLMTGQEMVALLGLGKMKLPQKGLDASQAASERAGDGVGTMSRSQKTSAQNCDPSESLESTQNEDEGYIKNQSCKRAHSYHTEDKTKGYPIQLNDHCVLMVASLSADVVPETQESYVEIHMGMPPRGEQKETYKGEVFEKTIVEDAMNRMAEKVPETSTEAGGEEPSKCMSVEEDHNSGSPRDSNKGAEDSPPLCIDLSQYGELPDAAAGAYKDNSIYKRRKKRKRHKVINVVDHAVDSQGEGQGSKGDIEVEKVKSPENLIEPSINNHEPFDSDKVIEGPHEPNHHIPSSSQDTMPRPEEDNEASGREARRSGLSPEDDEASGKEMQRSILSLEDREVSRRACNEEYGGEKLRDVAMKKRKKRKKKAIHGVYEHNNEAGTNSGSLNREDGWANKHIVEGSRCTRSMEPPYAVTEVKEGQENVGEYVCGEEVVTKRLKRKKVVVATENIEAQDQDLPNVHEVDRTSSPLKNTGFVIKGIDEPKHHIPSGSRDTRLRPEYDEAFGKEMVRSEVLPEDDESSRQEMQRSKLSSEDDESFRRETRRSKSSKGATNVDVENCNDELVASLNKNVSQATDTIREESPQDTIATGRPCIAGQEKLVCIEECDAEKLKDLALKKRNKRKKKPVQAFCDQNLEAGTNFRPLNSESGGADGHIDQGSRCIINMEPPNAVTDVKEGLENGGVYSSVEQVAQNRPMQKKVVVAMENVEAQGEDIASVLKVDGTSSPLMNTSFVVTSSTNEAVDASAVKDFEVYEFESSQTGDERQTCQLEANSTRAEAPDLDQLCSAAVKIVEEDMHNSSSTVACRRTARKSVHPKRWITVLSERLTWNQSSKNSSKRKSMSTARKPTRKGSSQVEVQAAVDRTSEICSMGEQEKEESGQLDVEAGKIACPAGCGRLYTKKTSAFYRHRRKCAG